MASREEKVNCVLWLAGLKSTNVVQRRFRTKNKEETLNRNSILKRMKKKLKKGSVHDNPRSGRPGSIDHGKDINKGDKTVLEVVEPRDGRKSDETFNDTTK